MAGTVADSAEIIPCEALLGLGRNSREHVFLLLGLGADVSDALHDYLVLHPGTRLVPHEFILAYGIFRKAELLSIQLSILSLVAVL